MPMKRSPKLRPAPWDALVVLAVLLLAAGSLPALGGGAHETEALTAVVTIDGREADRFPLTELLAGTRTYTAGGITLEVRAGSPEELSGADAPSSIEPAGVCVARSSCPTQDCVRTGVITRSGQSVICLPARFILRLEGGPAEDGHLDLIIG